MHSQFIDRHADQLAAVGCDLESTQLRAVGAHIDHLERRVAELERENTLLARQCSSFRECIAQAAQLVHTVPASGLTGAPC